MCFDTNKQYLGAGDVIKDVRTRPHPPLERLRLLRLVFVEIGERRFRRSNEYSTREDRSIGTIVEGERRNRFSFTRRTQSDGITGD